MTSYSRSVATLALAYTISEIERYRAANLQFSLTLLLFCALLHRAPAKFTNTF